MANLSDEIKVLIPIYGIKKSLDIYDSEVMGTKPMCYKRLKVVGKGAVRFSFANFYNVSLAIAIYKGLEALIS